MDIFDNQTDPEEIRSVESLKDLFALVNDGLLIFHEPPPMTIVEIFINDKLDNDEKLDFLLLLLINWDYRMDEPILVLLYFEYLIQNEGSHPHLEEILVFVFLFNLKMNFGTREASFQSLSEKISEFYSFQSYMELHKKMEKRMSNLKDKYVDLLHNIPTVDRNKFFTLKPHYLDGIADIKSVTYPVLISHPAAIFTIIDHLNNGLFDNKSKTQKFLMAIVAISRYLPLLDKTEVIKKLQAQLQVKTTTQTLEIEIIVSLWFLSGNTSFLNLRTKNQKVLSKIERILKNPEKQYEKYKQNGESRYDTIKNTIENTEKRHLMTYSDLDIYTIKSKSPVYKFLITGGNTMYDLAQMIINQFDFDPFHLYSFFMDNKAFSSKFELKCSEDNEGPYMTNTKIMDLKLVTGQKFVFIHDFGDENIVRLEVIDYIAVDEDQQS